MDPARPADGRAGHRLTTRVTQGGGGAGPPIVLNRRAATRPTITGVERWTAEVIGELIALAPDRYVVAQPRPRARGRILAQTWEQLGLPARAARMGATLVFSPANLAPVAWPRNVVVMHDAAAQRFPEAYSRAYRLWHDRVGSACARRALAVITVSEFSRRELAEVTGVDPTRIVVIPGGVGERFTADTDRLADGAAIRRLGLHRPYVLTIASDDPRKNLGSLSTAAAALAERGIDVVWAGDSRAYFARTGPIAGVRRLGYVDEPDLPALYRGACAFVLPSRYEGFGLTCLEAMACGTPVVAANRGALPETCGDAALLVDPDDPGALATAVVIAATDPNVQAALRAAGRRRASGYTWRRAAQRTDALLTELARGRTGDARQ